LHLFNFTSPTFSQQTGALENSERVAKFGWMRDYLAGGGVAGTGGFGDASSFFGETISLTSPPKDGAATGFFTGIGTGWAWVGALPRTDGGADGPPLAADIGLDKLV
jgi:hypothetical protein